MVERKNRIQVVKWSIISEGGGGWEKKCIIYPWKGLECENDNDVKVLTQPRVNCV